MRRLLRAEQGGRVTERTSQEARFRLDLLGLELWMYQVCVVWCGVLFSGRRWW